MSAEGTELLSADEREKRNQAIRSLLDRLDQHAPGERAHAQRVAVYSVATGEKMGLGDAELLELRYAAELHDIGKLGVPSDILLAARPLEREERAIVERHVVDVGSFLPEDAYVTAVIPIIEAHHERWEGGGYPKGLKGDDIPLAARIIGAAEALDVMLQGTAWRAAFPTEAALSAMKGLGGSWFDPQVVECLLEVQPLIQPLD